MRRLDIIQGIINQKKNVTYLEIGVFRGQVFLKVKAKRKIAIDPQFKIRKTKRLRYYFRNPSNLNSKYFEMPSDDFFQNHAEEVKNGIDVAFVDGLHTYEQALTDVENCLKYLNPGGVIIMHDCSPPSAAAAQYAFSPTEAASLNHPEWNDEWTGDVFKALLHLRAAHNDLDIFVVDCDYGVGVVRCGEPEAPSTLSVDDVKKMTYEEFAPQREKLLNLKSPEYFNDWVKTFDKPGVVT